MTAMRTKHRIWKRCRDVYPRGKVAQLALARHFLRAAALRLLCMSGGRLHSRILYAGFQPILASTLYNCRRRHLCRHQRLFCRRLRRWSPTLAIARMVAHLAYHHAHRKAGLSLCGEDKEVLLVPLVASAVLPALQWLRVQSPGSVDAFPYDGPVAFWFFRNRSGIVAS